VMDEAMKTGVRLHGHVALDFLTDPNGRIQ
jgi:hypothetical protein